MSEIQTGYDASMWEAPTTAPASPETTRGRAASGLERVRHNPEAREKAKRLATVGLTSVAKELGLDIGPDGRPKVRPLKLARTLANPTGAAARAARGAGQGIRREATGMAVEAAMNRFGGQPSAGSLESPVAAPVETSYDFGDPMPLRESSYSTEIPWDQQPTPTASEAWSDSAWSSAPEAPQTAPNIPKRGRFESQKKYEDRVVADIADRTRPSSDPSGDW